MTKTKHGLSRSPEYLVWASMKQRCQNSSCKPYHRYGSRGIKVCLGWKQFSVFYKDMGPRPSKAHTLERIDNNGNYQANNCRWATRLEQAQNRSTTRSVLLDGESASVAEWARRIGLSHGGMIHRLRSDSIAPKEQSRGGKVFLEKDGRRQSLAKWSKELGINRATITSRLSSGWEVGRALSIANDGTFKPPKVAA